MKLQIKAWLKNGDVFIGAQHPETESYFRISYDLTEGRPMKWGATMEDAEPEEPAEVEITKIELRLGENLWTDVTASADQVCLEVIEVRISEGEFA